MQQSKKTNNKKTLSISYGFSSAQTQNPEIQLQIHIRWGISHNPFTESVCFLFLRVETVL